MVAETVFVAGSITDTVPESWLGTYTAEPSGSTTGSLGSMPTPTVAITVDGGPEVDSLGAISGPGPVQPAASPTAITTISLTHPAIGALPHLNAPLCPVDGSVADFAQAESCASAPSGTG